jgi:hypothetical protein
VLLQAVTFGAVMVVAVVLGSLFVAVGILLLRMRTRRSR